MIFIWRKSGLEFGAVVWHSGLTKSQKCDLERIQKIALKIVLGNEYQSYAHALATFSLQNLDERRVAICTKFAIKLYCSDRRRQFFDLANNDSRTRSKKLLVKEKQTRTKRCSLAPHIFLARLVNENMEIIRKKLSSW